MSYPVSIRFLRSRWQTLDRSLFAQVLVTLALVISIGTAITLKTEVDGYRQQITSKEKARIDRRVVLLSHHIKNTLGDLRLVAQSRHVREFLETGNQELLDEMAQDFSNLIEARQIYDQVRYIDQTGLERARVDLVNGKAVIVPSDKLQNKALRYYFADTTKLDAGEVYMSPFDLNVERGRIEVPYKPTIRLATPLFNSKGQRRGIAILNYFGNDLMQSLNPAEDKGNAFIELLNHDGYWLISQDASEEWGFMFGKKDTFAVEHPDVWQNMQRDASGQLLSDENLWTWSRIYPLTNKQHSSTGSMQANGVDAAPPDTADYYWTAISQIPLGYGALINNGIVLRYSLTWCASMALVVLLSWMIALRQGRLNLAHEQTRMARMQNDLILTAAGEGICGIDVNGCLTFINPAARCMFGWSNDEGLGWDLHEHAHHHLANGKPYVDAECPILKTVHDGEFRQVSNDYFWRKDGSGFPVEYTVTPIKQDIGVAGAVVIFHDISERKKSEQILLATKEQAEQASAAKSRFLSSMSHEMRTPMNAILGFAELMSLDRSLNTVNRTNVGEILNAGHHLLDLINGVLDLAKVESGQMDMHLEPVEIYPVFKECSTLLAKMATRRGVRITHSGLEGAAVHADRLQFKQALINLLSNAIKYNLAGGEVQLKIQRQDTGMLRILVSDTGPGIPADKLEQLFQPFNRLGAERGSVEGTGIGLTIVRRTVEMMGGAVGVQSEVGYGSTFWIELPGAAQPTMQPETQQTDPPQEPEPSPSAHRHTVLYIDDNPVNLNLANQIMNKRPQIRLLTAQHPSLGIGLAKAHKPDLILLDINMPGMDGYQVLDIIKTDDRLKHIPVVALTAYAMDADIQRGMMEGFTDYLTKPINVSKLLSLLDRILKATP